MPFINRCGGGGSAKLQSKTVKSTTSQQTVSPDSGYDGFSSVTVSPIKLQAKSVSPLTTSAKVFPDTGYDGLSQVTVNKMDLVSKTVTPTNEKQTVSPGAGYDGLSSVVVNAAPLETKTITQTGTFTPSSGKVGFSQVTVDIGTFFIATNSGASGTQPKGIDFEVDDSVDQTKLPAYIYIIAGLTKETGFINSPNSIRYCFLSRLGDSDIYGVAAVCTYGWGIAATGASVSFNYGTMNITIPSASSFTFQVEDVADENDFTDIWWGRGRSVSLSSFQYTLIAFMDAATGNSSSAEPGTMT